MLQKRLPRLIQGTLFLDHGDADTAFELFDTAFAAGCSAFDTAAVYARGAAERLLGDWIRTRGVVSDVIVIDKGCHPVDGLPRMTPADLRHDIGAALERLQLQRIDLYLLHRDNPLIPPDEIVSALNEAVGEGQISAFGASNWTHQRLALANDYAARRGLIPFCATSPGFSLAEAIASWPGCVHLHRARDREVLRWYEAQQIAVLAWSPLASGFLTGRFTRDSGYRPEFGADRAALEFYGSDANFDRVARLRDLAQRYGVTLPQAALAYVLSTRPRVHAVIGCRDRTEFLICERALSLELSEAELDWLDSGWLACGAP